MKQEQEIPPEIIRNHNLSDQEFKKIKKILGRLPNLTELGIFSVMWSEHCSYKSSKKWLQTLPTKAPWVICGPGENAGIVDAKDNDAIVHGTTIATNALLERKGAKSNPFKERPQGLGEFFEMFSLWVQDPLLT